MIRQTVSIEDCRAAESRAIDHSNHGRHAESMKEYGKAAELWMKKADYAARYGETAISDMFKQEAQRNIRRKNAAFWDYIK